MRVIINGGDIFGRLTAIRKCEPHTTKNGGVYERWECSCECGKKKKVLKYSLTRGGTKSCGCLQSEETSKRSKIINRKHGETYSRTYNSWMSMKVRCDNPKNNRYKMYGGRGITYCERWKDLKFFIEDMGKRPEGMSLDRIKTNIGYSKENCRWATSKEQARNKRNNFIVYYNGESHCLSEWAEIKNLKTGTLWYRMRIAKWSIEKSLNEKA